MTIHGLVARDPMAPQERGEAADFDPTLLETLRATFGADGLLELIAIFEIDTRNRLRRLAGTEQDIFTHMRDLHTLKGAAATVGCAVIADLALGHEQAARKGKRVESRDLRAIEAALDQYLAAIRARRPGGSQPRVRARRPMPHRR